MIPWKRMIDDTTLVYLCSDDMVLVQSMRGKQKSREGRFESVQMLILTLSFVGGAMQMQLHSGCRWQKSVPKDGKQSTYSVLHGLLLVFTINQRFAWCPSTDSSHINLINTTFCSVIITSSCFITSHCVLYDCSRFGKLLQKKMYLCANMLVIYHGRALEARKRTLFSLLLGRVLNHQIIL
jgi:hypothetical protein